MSYGVRGLGFRIEGLGFSDWGLGFRVSGLRFRVWGLGVFGASFGDEGLFRVKGLGGCTGGIGAPVRDIPQL